MREVYLDNGSATKLDKRVIEAMLPYLHEEYGNAQSLHSLGQRAKDAIEQSRQNIARFINCRFDEIIFTSCGSESNNLALKGVASAYQQKGKHIIISRVEHFSVLQAAKRLQQSGFEITILPVDKYGAVALDELKKNLRHDTILVSIQHANPEIGTIQSIKELAEITHSSGALFHTDAVASAGIIPTDVNALGVDLLSFSNTTIYGPKGAGVLYFKKGTRLVPVAFRNQKGERELKMFRQLWD